MTPAKRNELLQASDDRDEGQISPDAVEIEITPIIPLPSHVVRISHPDHGKLKRSDISSKIRRVNPGLTVLQRPHQAKICRAWEKVFLQRQHPGMKRMKALPALW